MDEALSRLDGVRGRIDRAARLAGRETEDIVLVAVAKGQPAEAVQSLVDAGQQDFGESRVQEAQAKWAGIRGRERVRLHLVGRLQSNKASDALALFDAIHSVDRPSLIAALAEAAAGGSCPDCFLQVNIGEEPQKGGCAPAELPRLVELAREAGLPLAGLMAIPPVEREPAPYFALLAAFARRHGVTGLSMGMSGDFETAIMAGATHVRVGTALFGERP